MLQKLYKAFFFVSLVITALIAASVMYGDTSRIFINIFTNGYGEIPADVAAFFPIGITILCILLALLVSGIIYFIQKNKTDEPTPSKKNFFFFYFISLTAVSLLVLLFYSLRSDMYDRCISNYDVIVFAFLYGACVIEAVILAAFLMSFFTLWKTNKPVASIIGIIIILIIPANFISSQAIYEASSRCNARYRAAYHFDNTVGTSDYDSDDEVEADDYYEDVIEVVDDYLSFLWNEEDDTDAAFEYLFEEELEHWDDSYPQSFLSYRIGDLTYILSADEEEWSDLKSRSNRIDGLSGNTLRKIYRYLIKNPSEILAAFYSYQDIIYRYIPVYDFHNTAAETLLQQLTVAYNDLYRNNGLNRLRSIYTMMTKVKHDEARDYYHNIKPYINDDHSACFYDKDGDFHQGGVVWAYSFWARRNAEGIDDIAYRILSHLNEYYMYAAHYHYSDEEEEYEYDDEE